MCRSNWRRAWNRRRDLLILFRIHISCQECRGGAPLYNINERHHVRSEYALGTHQVQRQEDRGSPGEIWQWQERFCEHAQLTMYVNHRSSSLSWLGLPCRLTVIFVMGGVVTCHGFDHQSFGSCYSSFFLRVWVSRHEVTELSYWLEIVPTLLRAVRNSLSKPWSLVLFFTWF